MNRTQKFQPITPKDKKIARKRYFPAGPRKKGNMLLHYYNLTKGDYRNMYYTKIQYYQCFPAEQQYKDLHKKRKIPWRSYKEMKKDIKAQHRFFTNPVISSVEEEEEDDEVNDYYDDEDFDIDGVDNYY